MSERPPELVIHGDLVLPDRILAGGALGVADGRIIAIYAPGSAPEAPRTAGGEGLLVLPGAIDAHVHCYSEPAEGFRGATRSAAAGGVTTLVDMPYDAHAPVTTAEILRAKRERVAGESYVDVALLATIQKTGGLAEIPRLAADGACGFKVSTFETHPVRFPRIADGELLEAFRGIAATGLPCMVHAEDDELVAHAHAQTAGQDPTDPTLHSRSRPPVSEALAVVKLLELAHWTGVRLHIVHGTFPRIFQLVEAFRRDGLAVTAETCTHYLLLTEADLPRLGARAKVNPPLRSAADRDGLWHQLADGLIDMVTSDHAPWLPEKKQAADILANASGAPGVEALLPVLYSEGVARSRIDVHDLVRLVSAAPARLFGFSGRKGSLRVGLDADVVLIDPLGTSVIDEAHQHSVAGWSPYHGMGLQGRIRGTWVRGERVHDGADVVGSPEHGRFLAPEPPARAGAERTA